MEPINLEKISVAVSHKLGSPVTFVSIKRVGSGFHAEGFVLTAQDGKQYFIKRITAETAGFEFPERKLFSLMVGHDMAKRANMSPLPIGVFVETGDTIEVAPELAHHTTAYHVQEFEPNGSSYLSILSNRKDRSALQADDLMDIEHITDYAAKLHSITHPATDTQYLQAVYNDGLRAEVVHPELTLPFFDDIDDDHPFLSPEQQGEYIKLLLTTIRKWRNRHDRLRALHGDFWAANLFVRDDNTVWVIDYSRIPWGDPGIDVGKWMSFYLWLYYQTNNDYYRQLGDLFLAKYVEKTGDTEIVQAMVLGFAFTGALYSSPNIYPEVSMEVRHDIFTHMCSMLKNNRFSWKV